MIYYTADTHFSFPPIIRAAARPFSSMEEMNAVLIKNWNDTVTEDDTIFIVGDIAGDEPVVPRWIFEQLKGHKHLIRGNHDTGMDHQEDLFDYCETVTDYTEIEDGENHIILCHYPIIHNKRPYMIHGHIHNRRGQAFDMLKQLPQVLNAGVDINFFKPVTLEQLIKNNEMFYSDEHLDLFPDPAKVWEGGTPPKRPYKPVINYKPLPVKPVK